MNKKEWSIVIFPLLVVWILDRITKMWAMDLVGVKMFGPLAFTLHHNSGVMLGLFADLPPFLRVVSLSTGGAFLICIYVLLQYLMPIKSLTLRSGMSILLGGILGNVTDRILWGHIIDFIMFNVGTYNSPVMNVADILQWFGYGMIVYAIVREGEILWPENNVRKMFWINPKFQLKYCVVLMGVGLSIGLIAMVYSYTFLRVTMIELIGHNPAVLDKFLIPFVISYGIVVLGFSVALFTVGKIISHKIAGPIYAFEKYTNDLMNGKDREFKLRAKDEFKELEDLAKRIREKLK